jgi:hypothetical protein
VITKNNYLGKAFSAEIKELSAEIKELKTWA